MNGDTIPVPIDLATEMVSQVGGILIALITAFFGGKWWASRKNGNGSATNGLHQHLTAGFQTQLQETRDHYESLMREQREHHETLLEEYRKLHDERSTVIKEMADKIANLEIKIQHLEDILRRNQIPLPATPHGGAASMGG